MVDENTAGTSGEGGALSFLTQMDLLQHETRYEYPNPA